ncbi:MAG: hypothetical protein O2885_08630 [Proteobacteria bacterium]|nr:hypothetical protein [Pseudomonadota bacterium]
MELAGANDTADRRVINLSRFLQSLDSDGDSENGLSISSSARTALEDRSLNFNLPVSTFAISASVAVQSATGRSLVSASQAINHLHGTLGNRGLVDLVADTEEIQQVVPEFVADSTLSEAISANPELCQFNDILLSSGQSVIAYQSESVVFGQSCSSQTRTCNNGTLTGSYSASSCTVRAANDCSLNGQPVAHGADVTAYSSETVDFGDTCSSQVRTCSNGKLSGSFTASTCRVASAATCSFAGETIEHGTSVTAFSASSVAAGGNCLAELRSCENGVLSGIYTFGNCVVGNEEVKSSCTFDGKLINHGSIVTAYSSSSVPYSSTCTAQLRTCNDGILSGSYTASVCNVADALSCSFNSSNVAHGTNVTAYKTASVAYGSTCVSEQRTCSNGILTGSYAYSSCQVSPASACTFNGQTVAHGTNVTAYEDDEVNFGVSCRVQERTCSNGLLTGSYAYSNCTVAAAASCTFDDQTIPHGTNVTAYQNESVSFGSSCVSQQRTCSNGILTGSYTNPSCSVEGASSCTFNGETIESGSSVTAYQSSIVPYGSTCNNESRTCTNGSLSGTYSFVSCSMSPAAICSFNGQPIAHDGVVTAYQSDSVEYGNDCEAEVRTCSNGSLSGSYSFGSCSVSSETDWESQFNLLNSFPSDGSALDQFSLDKVILQFNHPVDRSSVSYFRNFHVEDNTICQWTICGWIEYTNNDKTVIWHNNSADNSNWYSSGKSLEIRLGARDVESWRITDTEGNKLPYSSINITFN